MRPAHSGVECNHIGVCIIPKLNPIEPINLSPDLLYTNLVAGIPEIVTSESRNIDLRYLRLSRTKKRGGVPPSS